MSYSTQACQTEPYQQNTSASGTESDDLFPVTHRRKRCSRPECLYRVYAEPLKFLKYAAEIVVLLGFITFMVRRMSYNAKYTHA